MDNFKEVIYQEVPIMAATYSVMNTQPCYCESCAAAGTSVRVINILDTALLAVSIIVIRLIALLVLKV